ncbi:cysteine desulfurase/selenocysteine lyase [Acholeplasma morum]|uniref:aminotransferase class V-fold PLP-dependent enzyme n=1 Tax=Paracholeplasma morum TaxID=264637 RepID=UPI001958A6E3|nr:cysteine desulfurase [Paracholeplasma morum]MBM7453399.1 cysteine desulfurase/selenocysteine lyase [Paracholeplasma morum]
MLDVKKIRQDFPIYETNQDLVYLDTAASSLKPKQVIDVVDHYYSKLGVNVHRGVYGLSYEATDLYESARHTVAKFLNAKFEEIVFTRGTTASLNLVASSYLDKMTEEDEIITSELEHHSSMLPWLHVSKKTKAKLKYVELDTEGRITVEAFKKVLSDKTKVVALTYVSNVMGYITPIKEIIDLAHQKGAIVVVDAAQAAPHMKIDVTALNADFLAFSGHKLCGPTGIGVLYGKRHLLNQMDPIEFGGDMSQTVDKFEATWKDAPYRFEAGTPIISGAIGLARALDYITSIGFDAIHEHVKTLHDYAIHKLEEVKGIEIYNKTAETGIVTFNVVDVHPHDAASIFDKNKVCIRAGHHCAQPITKWLKQIATLRATFYIYNTKEDVDVFVDSVKEAVRFFGAF